ncbi:envelope glycoprotein B [Rhynchospora pubera]|uniref:Envelope glycoprotein B n=1 Tax=Rhynchospora pubera TaxID=906938 RepID=A0AAV8H7G3_9POAL|nr:envelope glycoprotein B [Rhynchospora pubera]
MVHHFCSSFLLLFFLLPISASSFSHVYHEFDSESISGKEGRVTWRWLAEEAPTASNVTTLDNSSFVLAAQRTQRKDPLEGYNYYKGGWNISDQHYWASVAYTAFPLFTIAFIWFVIFGLGLFVFALYLCCCRRRKYSYSHFAYAVSLVLLIIFVCAAVVGCVVLYRGQAKFHKTTLSTLGYVMSQANLTVENLKNFSDSLGKAKAVGVDQIFLPSNVQSSIDNIETKLNASASSLEDKSANNNNSITKFLNGLQVSLILLAAVMLAFTFIGFLFSLCGMQFIVSVLIVVGWILVTVTFILCGVFLLFHNVLTDACVAMDEWVSRPHAHTALDDILPCVDVATANESMYRSREVTYQLVGIVNQVITNISNQNFPPAFGAPLYYNQSGPLIPPLCNPYNSDMSDRTCLINEATFDNSSTVWKEHECQTAIVNGNEICTTVGRITPSLYSQMIAATSISKGLYQYGPFLTQLEDCSFVRETFATISTKDCPGLDKYTRWIYIGLDLVSVAVMLSLIFWIIFVRERRHRNYNKEFLTRSSQAPHPL